MHDTSQRILPLAAWRGALVTAASLEVQATAVKATRSKAPRLGTSARRAHSCQQPAGRLQVSVLLGIVQAEGGEKLLVDQGVWLLLGPVIQLAHRPNLKLGLLRLRVHAVPPAVAEALLHAIQPACRGRGATCARSASRAKRAPGFRRRPRRLLAPPCRAKQGSFSRPQPQHLAPSSPQQLTLVLFVIVCQPHTRQGRLLPVPAPREVCRQAAPVVGDGAASAGDNLSLLGWAALGVAPAGGTPVQGAAPRQGRTDGEDSLRRIHCAGQRHRRVGLAGRGREARRKHRKH